LNQLFNLITNSKTEAIICVFVFLMGYLVRLVRPFTVHDRLSQTKVIDISQLRKQQQEASS
jgi:hypothetical protein